MHGALGDGTLLQHISNPTDVRQLEGCSSKSRLSNFLSFSGQLHKENLPLGTLVYISVIEHLQAKVVCWKLNQEVVSNSRLVKFNLLVLKQFTTNIPQQHCTVTRAGHIGQDY